MASESAPYVRPIHTGSDAQSGDKRDRGFDPSVTSIPWIDVHQHTQTLSWNDQDEMALGGCEAVATIAYNPHWSPYRPVATEDVRFQWDLAIKWTDFLDANHLFKTYVVAGIHTNAKVENPGELLDVLPAYCRHETVVAIGETGIEPVQYDSRWPIDDQKPVVRRQMEIADATGLPIIVHTPTTKTGVAAGDKGWGGLRLSKPDPSIDYQHAKAEATAIDVELKDDAGLADEQVVIDHGDPSIVEFVMENTNCYLGFSVSSPLKGVTSADIATAIDRYGPDRIVVDSDMMGYRRCDFSCIPRTMQDLHKAGIERSDIRTVFYENPAEILGLDPAK